MTEILFTIAVVILGIFLTGVGSSGFTSDERPVVWAGFAVHTFATFLFVWITLYIYRGGDLYWYHHVGNNIAEWLTRDFSRLPEVLKLVFHLPERIPVTIPVRQSATGSMFGISGLAHAFLGGSLYASALLLGTCAFLGQLAIYAAFRQIFAPRFHTRLIIAALLVPSVVFWSSGLLKETVAMAGFGFAFYGARGLIMGEERSKHLIIMFLGALPVALVKSYILVPFFVALAVWYYWQRSLETRGTVAVLSKPLYLVLGVAVSLGAIILLGEIFPRFSFANVGDELTKVQHYQQRSGGSTYQLVENPAEATLATQLLLVPIALFSTLFRPLIIEVHNAMSLINALETTAILGLAIGIVFKRGLRDSYQTVANSPTAMFCLTFTLLFGVAVGLASPNLGSLSRYRIPMMPFWVGLLLLLWPSKSSAARPRTP